jgi:hypothetical protein
MGKPFLIRHDEVRTFLQSIKKHIRENNIKTKVGRFKLWNSGPNTHYRCMVCERKIDSDSVRVKGNTKSVLHRRCVPDLIEELSEDDKILYMYL